MTLIGGLVALFGTRGVRKANAARDWPAVDGRVTTSYTDETVDAEGAKMYKAIIHYSYTVGGQSYSGSKVTLGVPISTSWRNPADRLVATYPPDRPCRVFCNPEDPTESCLRPGAGWLAYLMTAAGYLVALIGSALLLR
jgi:hypothetical protein